MLFTFNFKVAVFDTTHPSTLFSYYVNGIKYKFSMHERRSTSLCALETNSSGKFTKLTTVTKRI